jgi:predicted transcriptional regulator/transcriptional regulator with XRE-family HTH domain
VPSDRRLYVGPSLRRLRRDRGLTQSDMAADLEVSPSYIALLERNHRPLSAEMLLRLAQTYTIDLSTLAGDGAADERARLQAALKDPIFADIDLPSLETSDVATNFPGVVEAFLRLYTTYQEEHLALADRGVDGVEAADPVAEARRFLAARRNSFPSLDDAAERLAQGIGEHDSLVAYLKARHDLRVRRVPPKVMVGSTRRLDYHRRQILLDDELDHASQMFQLALQLAYLELRPQIAAVLKEGVFASENGERLANRALAGYAAAAILMPYAAFARAVEARRYDIEALARQFGASFEQVAHRLTTLQKPGQEGVPFFFIRVDAAGNVSKRLDGAGFPFARHGGGCPLWNLHQAFRTPRQVVTQWLELPDGQRFFSMAGRAWSAPSRWAARPNTPDA